MAKCCSLKKNEMKTANCLNDELLDIIIDLHEKGFDHDFILENKVLRCLQYSELFVFDDIRVLEIRGCSVDSRPRICHYLIGVELIKYNIKGILLVNYQWNSNKYPLQESPDTNSKVNLESLKEWALFSS